MTAGEGLPDLYLVDGSGFIFRAYHALPPLNRPDGTPVGAVLGFTNMLVKLLTDFHAGQVAVIFDSARETFRNDIYPDYKANRDDPPEDLIPQFALIREATRAFALPCLELDGYEADDLIATYAAQARARGQKVVIVSSDKDLMQLVGDGVEMFDPIKLKPIRAAEVEEKFGVPPRLVTQVQALAGDSVDNVPGVPGIGVKTAAQLLGEFGDLETLLEKADTIRQPKRRENLLNHAEDARLSLRLVTLVTDAPVPEPLDALKLEEIEHEKLRAFLEEQGFRSVIGRLSHLGAPAETPAVETPVDTTPAGADYALVQDEAALKGWIARAEAAGRIGIDTETDSLRAATATLVGVSLAVAPGQACYIPLAHRGEDGEGGLALAGDRPDQIATDRAMALLKPLLEDPAVLKIGHNLKFDAQLFARHGITLAPLDDTMLLSYLVGSTGGHGLDALAENRLGHKVISFGEVAGKGKAQVTFDRVPLDKARDYAAEDADITLRLHRQLKPELVKARLVTLYERIERPLVPVIAAMERRGIKVDPAILRQMSGDFASRLEVLEGEVQELSPRPFNLGSPRQLGEVLFEEIGLPGGKKTKSGAWSTDAGVLEGLAGEHAIVRKVLDWRQLAKLKSTYTDALQDEIDPATGRVHTAFSMALTTTGRLSSSNPNLQNIPIRTEEGRKIRTAFVAEPGHKLISVDYSQIELRLVAHIAGIEALKESFRKGEDIHRRTAAEVFGLEIEAVDAEARRRAKAINFGIIYGISGWGLANNLGIPQAQARAYIDQYLEKYPQLRDYMDRVKAEAREKGHVETLFGRQIRLDGIRDRNQARRSFAERQAINAPIQGTAADIIKAAMIRVEHRLDAETLKTKMLLQVHDELIFEAPEEETERVIPLIREEMEGVVEYSVPLVAEAGIGDSWAEAH